MKKKKLFKTTFFFMFCLLISITIIGNLLICIGFSYSNIQQWNPLDEQKKDIIFILLCSQSICCGISGILAFIFSKKIIKPILKISEITKQMRELKDDIVCKIETKDELADLAEDINELYKELRETIEQLQKETINRRKLEAYKINFEGGISDKKKYIESKGEKEQEESLQLSNVILQAVKPYLLIAKAKKIQVEINLEDSFYANIPPNIFKQIVENLFFYAIYNTSTGKKVYLNFQGCNFIIQNECTPFSLNELGRILEYPSITEDRAGERLCEKRITEISIATYLLSMYQMDYFFIPCHNGMKFIISF